MGFIKNIVNFFQKKEQSFDSEEMKMLLISNDMSYATASYIMQKIKKSLDVNKDLAKTIEYMMLAAETDLFTQNTKPSIVFIYGVNGSGKTTTIAKLANILQKEGKKVIVAACDTFRAAAVSQLEHMLQKISCPLQMAESEKSDPASVAFVAAQRALNESFDVLIIDTAGRLHTNVNLSQELLKIHKVVLKVLPNVEYANIAVMDATIGQNSLAQIQKFNLIVPISGVIITKLDTTAKGGALISVIYEMKKMVYFTCHGPLLDDISKFNAKEFVQKFLE